MKPELWHEVVLQPTFHDLDPMNVVWHGNYPKYLEIARCALLAKFGYDYPQMRDSGYAWPIVDMRLKYVGPATFKQDLRIRAEIVEWENRLKIDYKIFDQASGRVIHKAHTVQVAVDLQTQAMQYICPAVLWRCLGVEPA